MAKRTNFPRKPSHGQEFRIHRKGRLGRGGRPLSLPTNRVPVAAVQRERRPQRDLANEVGNAVETAEQTAVRQP